MIQNIGTENGIIIELLIYTNIKRTPPPSYDASTSVDNGLPFDQLFMFGLSIISE